MLFQKHIMKCVGDVVRPDELDKLKSEFRKQSNEMMDVINSWAAQKRIIQSQSDDIRRLNDQIGILQSEVDRLSDNLNRLMNETKTVESEQAVQENPTEDTKYLTFTDDFQNNQELLQNMIEQTKLLRARITERYHDQKDFDIYLKLVDKCIEKLERISEKNQDHATEAEKLANDCVKAFKQTVVKAMSQEKLRDVMREYMAKCNFRKLDWKVGKTLTNDDYDYLEEPVLYVDVEDKSMDDSICDIKQDTYIIDYIEDDEKYEAVIPGIYCIGRYKNR